MKHTNLVLIAFAFVVVAFAAFVIGYGIGRNAGADALFQSVMSALAEREQSGDIIIPTNSLVTSKPTMPVQSQVQSVCAVVHPDGNQCISDGNGGFLPHD